MQGKSRTRSISARCVSSLLNQLPVVTAPMVETIEELTHCLGVSSIKIQHNACFPLHGTGHSYKWGPGGSGREGAYEMRQHM